jgi:hypothetical protein
MSTPFASLKSSLMSLMAFLRASRSLDPRCDDSLLYCFVGDMARQIPSKYHPAFENVRQPRQQTPNHQKVSRNATHVSPERSGCEPGGRSIARVQNSAIEQISRRTVTNSRAGISGCLLVILILPWNSVGCWVTAKACYCQCQCQCQRQSRYPTCQLA